MFQKLALQLPGMNNPITAPGGAPSDVNKTPQIIQIVIQVLFIVAILYALWMLIRGGLSWIYSEGDKQRLEQARNRIIYAILGLIVVLLAFFIVSFISHIFGVDILSLPT